MNPLWNTLLVAGLQDGTPFLGLTDKLGVAFAEDAIATGYGAYIALVCSSAVLQSMSWVHGDSYEVIIGTYAKHWCAAVATGCLGAQGRTAHSGRSVDRDGKVHESALLP
jgi:hypothetical protein